MRDALAELLKICDGDPIYDVRKDAIGNDIRIGDTVLYADVDGGSVVFEKAKIIRLTPKKIEVEYLQSKWGVGRYVRYLTSESRLIKHTHNEATSK